MARVKLERLPIRQEVLLYLRNERATNRKHEVSGALMTVGVFLLLPAVAVSGLLVTIQSLASTL